MLRSPFVLSLSIVAIGSLSSCDKAHDAAPIQPIVWFAAPQPNCYSGTVVGFDCWNGFLVEVDAQYPIGAPLRMASTHGPQPRLNVIAAVNRLDSLGTMGQRIYFTCTDDPNRQTPSWPCLAMQAQITFPLPHVVLANVSATPCAPRPNE